MKKPVKRLKLSDELASRIRQHIVRNRLVQGDRLPQERVLVEQLGASRATVREALKSLEVQGLIYNVTGPEGGARVAGVSREHASDLLRNYFYFNPIKARQLYQVRLQIEPELAASVAGTLTPQQLQALEDNVREQESLELTHANWRAHREAEVVFHDLLMQACTNPLLALVAHVINQAIRTNIGLTEPPEAFEAAREFTHDNLACHHELLEALRAGDAGRARTLMRAHVAAAEPYVDGLDPYVAVNLPQVAQPAGDE